LKYEFQPIKCPKVDCGVKECQSDDGCDDHNSKSEDCDPQSEAVSREGEGEMFLVSNDVEEDE
jgi:hypothetical protein